MRPVWFLLQNSPVKSVNHHPQEVEQAAAAFEIIVGFQNALDLSYRRIVHVAARHWEQAFPGKDPSDSCVTVRIAPSTKTVPGSGFLSGHKTARDHAIPPIAPASIHSLGLP